MKKTIFDISPIIIFFISIFIFLILLLIVCLNYNTVLFVVFLLISFLFFVFLFFLVNVSSPIITYKDGIITRRGLFFGFYKTVKANEIIKIDHLILGRMQFYELCDGKSIPYSMFRRDSSIKIPYSEKGKEFIKLFWDKEIPK